MTRKENSRKYFATKAAAQKINANLKAKHPEYSAQKRYAMTKSILAAQTAKTNA